MYAIINDLNHLLDKKFLSLEDFQNYLTFHQLFNTLKLCSPNYVEVASWKSVGKPIEEITLSEIIVTTEVKHSQEGDLSFKFAKNK